jgi:hypothetical protein
MYCFLSGPGLKSSEPTHNVIGSCSCPHSSCLLLLRLRWARPSLPPSCRPTVNRRESARRRASTRSSRRRTRSDERGGGATARSHGLSRSWPCSSSVRSSYTHAMSTSARSACPCCTGVGARSVVAPPEVRVLHTLGAARLTYILSRVPRRVLHTVGHDNMVLLQGASSVCSSYGSL